MSQTTPPPSAIRRLPVGQTVLEAYGAVLSRLGLLFRAAALPFVLWIVIAGLSLLAQGNWFLSFILVALGFVPYTLFGVAWHRLTLLGPGAAAPSVMPGWTLRHWRFLGYLVAVMLIVYLFTSIPVLFGALAVGADGRETVSLVEGLLVLVAALALALGLPYVMLRLSFVFPAAAVDEVYGFSHSWTHTRGQGFRLLGAVLLTASPMLALIWAVASILGVYLMPDIEISLGAEGARPETGVADFGERNAGAILLAEFVLAAINFVLMALLVSAISIAFRTCTGWIPATGGPPAPTRVAREPSD